MLNNIELGVKRGVKRGQQGNSIPYNHQQSPPPPPHGGSVLGPFPIFEFGQHRFDDNFFEVYVPVFDVKHFSLIF